MYGKKAALHYCYCFEKASEYSLHYVSTPGQVSTIMILIRLERLNNNIHYHRWQKEVQLGGAKVIMPEILSHT